jgi:hypothetical protein
MNVTSLSSDSIIAIYHHTESSLFEPILISGFYVQTINSNFDMSKFSFSLHNSMITLSYSAQRRQIPAVVASTKCTLFRNIQDHPITDYQIHSLSHDSHFQQFVSVLLGNEVEITRANYAGLRALSEELGFEELLAQLSDFDRSMKVQPTETPIRVNEENPQPQHRFRRSIRRSFRNFRRFSQSFERRHFPFCGGEASTVSQLPGFIRNAMAMQTL